MPVTSTVVLPGSPVDDVAELVGVIGFVGVTACWAAMHSSSRHALVGDQEAGRLNRQVDLRGDAWRPDKGQSRRC